MARVYQDGFEFNSVTANPATWETISGSPTISSSIFRSGAYAGRVSSLSSGAAMGWVKKWLSATADGPFWGRAYIRIATLPSASNHIMSFNSATGTAGNSDRIKITLESDGTLILRLADGTAIGSPSAVLALDTWYIVELKFDRTPAGGSEIAEARLGADDGTTPTVFATSNTLTLAGAAFAFSLGGNLDLEAQTQGDWYFDDVAVNDSAGSFQNSYPGHGKIIHLRPNAAGDADEWSLTSTYEEIDEITPDDATTAIANAATDQVHDVNIDDTPAALNSGSTINAILVGVRFNKSAGVDDPTFVARVKASSGGTVEESTAFTVSSTSWNSNGSSSPRNYPLVLYDLPGASTDPWTKALLDTAQVGVKMTNTVANLAQVTTIWMSVDFTPTEAAGSAAQPTGFMTTNTGFWG